MVIKEHVRPDVALTPALIIDVEFQRMSMSPRWKAGAIDSEITHMSGFEELDMTHNPFQAMSGVVIAIENARISARRSLIVSP